MIRVAILGAGIGREHLQAYRKLPKLFDVRWIVDQDEARAESIRSGADFQVSGDIGTVLQDAQVDLIDICLPPQLHTDVAVQALGAGKHVICEKPLATSLKDVARIAVAQAAANRQVFPVFQYRWGPSLAQLRHLIALGLTGQPQVASLETHWSRDADYYAAPWRGTWAGENGGAVLGHAIHNHDLLTHIMGPVATVSAMASTRINDIETEDCAAISFTMENGSLATSSITLGAAFDRTRLRFVFEHLTATSGDAPYAPGSDPWRFEARDPSQQNSIDAAVAAAPDEAVGFEGFLSEVAKAVAGQENQAVRMADGRASIELVTAIYHAARTGQRVHLPIEDRHLLFDGWRP
ncbi:MAG: Gfo/Idh/MocA family oxidoreductase [Rhodobacteraceae bacterium]|nr:Gfo/Idh/MocA family oxidoreductase [Paracoccaceae bacterium]